MSRDACMAHILVSFSLEGGTGKENKYPCAKHGARGSSCTRSLLELLTREKAESMLLCGETSQ